MLSALSLRFWLPSKSSEGSEAPRTKTLEFTLKFGGSKVKVQFLLGPLTSTQVNFWTKRSLVKG